jgi:hypothetical protein
MYGLRKLRHPAKAKPYSYGFMEEASSWDRLATEVCYFFASYLIGLTNQIDQRTISPTGLMLIRKSFSFLQTTASMSLDSLKHQLSLGLKRMRVFVISDSRLSGSGQTLLPLEVTLPGSLSEVNPLALRVLQHTFTRIPLTLSSAERY